MNPGLKRILVLIVGWGFILLGIVGLFLPLLQGVLFVFVGLVILSSQYPRARLVLRKLRARFPKTGRVADAARAKVARWFQRLSRQRHSD
jgi:uncharacterized protein